MSRKFRLIFTKRALEELSHFGFVTKDPQSSSSMIIFENMHPNFRWRNFLDSSSHFIQPKKLGSELLLQEAEVALARSTPLLKMRL